jgi:hypothetical protein
MMYNNPVVAIQGIHRWERQLNLPEMLFVTHVHHLFPHSAHHVLVSPDRGECIGNEACEMWTAHDGDPTHLGAYAVVHEGGDGFAIPRFDGLNDWFRGHGIHVRERAALNRGRLGKIRKWVTTDCLVRVPRLRVC